MKALWIRVEAHDVDSRQISRFAESLGISEVLAVGHCTVFAGALAEQTDDGRIDLLTDAEIEKWGRWAGKRGKFAAAVREHLQADDGTFREWLETMGKLVDRRTRDRLRKEEERRKRAEEAGQSPRKVRGTSVDNPRTVRGTSAATERNGTVRKDGESSAVGEIENKRALNTSARDPRSATDVAAPLRSLALNQLLDALDPRVRGFLETFYRPHARADLDRVRDVGLQLLALQRGEDVPDHRRQLVRAYSLDRLALKCRQVQLAPPRDPNAAMAILLIKLGDTSDLAGSGALPGQVDAKAHAPNGPLDPSVQALVDGVATAFTPLAAGLHPSSTKSP